MIIPWFEKHRPKKLENILLTQQLKQFGNKILDEKNMPNLILEGQPGVGKTTTIKCIARELYKDKYDFMVMELNASDDRGKKIYDTINIFRKTYNEIKNDIPTFKMIILDEADNMTEQAQNIICSFIKKYPDELKFAFTCNEKEGISIAIQSCCYILKYPGLTKEFIVEKLKDICMIEKIEINASTISGLKIIASLSEKDMRKAINTLQLIYNSYGRVQSNDIIQDKPYLGISRDIIKYCYNDKNMEKAISSVLELKNRGYSGTDIASGIKYALLDLCDDIDENIKIKIWSCCEYAIICISKGLDTSIIQIVALICDIYSKINE